MMVKAELMETTETNNERNEAAALAAFPLPPISTPWTNTGWRPPITDFEIADIITFVPLPRRSLRIESLAVIDCAS